MAIHPTAIIDARAEVDPTAEIGPFVIVNGPSRIGARTKIMAHAIISPWCEIGEDNIIHYGAVIGHEPQHLAYKGEERWTKIGNRNIIREYSTVHRAFVEGKTTTIGDDCLLMTYAHVGHDSTIGNRVVLVSNVLIGGHVEVEDGAFLGGGSAVHQFSRIGKLVMVAGLARVTQDVPPFMMVAGDSKIRSLNIIGMRRANIGPEARMAIKRAYRILYHQGIPVTQALEEIRQTKMTPEVHDMVNFILRSKRGISGHYHNNMTTTIED